MSEKIKIDLAEIADYQINKLECYICGLDFGKGDAITASVNKKSKVAILYHEACKRAYTYLKFGDS